LPHPATQDKHERSNGEAGGSDEAESKANLAVEILSEEGNLASSRQGARFGVQKIEGKKGRGNARSAEYQCDTDQAGTDDGRTEDPSEEWAH
jgi:hypothetical protein